MRTTWRSQLEAAMHDQHDLGPVVAYGPDEAAFDVEFNDGFGAPAGEVLAWTATNVYFPLDYEGVVCLGWAPRNPVSVRQETAGGK